MRRTCKASYKRADAERQAKVIRRRNQAGSGRFSQVRGEGG